MILVVVLPKKETDPQEYKNNNPIKSIPFIEDKPLSIDAFDLSVYGI